MINSYHQKLDILKERRKLNNAQKNTYDFIKKNRRKGYFLGVLISGVSIICCVLFSIHTLKRDGYKQLLVKDVSEYDDLKKNYGTILQQTEFIYNTNKRISLGIIGIQSGSTLLAELKNILPDTIQLKYINSSNNKLELKSLKLFLNIN